MTVNIESSEKHEKVCILGLGFVGLTLAITLASIGYQVYGVEISPKVLDNLKRRKASFYEPNLEASLASVLSNGNLKFGSEYDPTFGASIFIVSVGTPFNKESSKPNLSHVEGALNQIKPHLKSDSIVIMRSTLAVGTCAALVIPLVRSVYKTVGVAFCPERTVEGRALQELFELPQIISATDNVTRDRVTRFFSRLTKSIVQVSSLETAELVKLVDNTYRDVCFAFSNEIAGVADALGVNAKEVIDSANLGYKRNSIYSQGLVGGPCLEKDPHILSFSSAIAGYKPTLISTARAIHESLPEREITYLKKYFSDNRPDNFLKGSKVAILGMAFKGEPPTNDTRGSLAIKILDLVRTGFDFGEICIHDPMLSQSDVESFGAKFMPDLSSAFRNASLVIICNNHRIYRFMDLSIEAKSMRCRGIVFDYWALHSRYPIKLTNDVEYKATGFKDF